MTSIVKIAVDGVDGDTAASGARGSNDGYCDAALTRVSFPRILGLVDHEVIYAQSSDSLFRIS